MHGLIIIPTYNDVAFLKEGIRSSQLDVLIIDDGSEVDIRGQLLEDENIRYIRLPKNNGKGFALRKGFTFAIEEQYDYVVTMDADGEHDPGDLPDFCEHILAADIVIGERQTFRGILSKVLNHIGTLSFRTLIPGIRDTQCGFRAFRTSVLKDMTLTARSFEIETEMLLEASRMNASIRMIGINSRGKRLSGMTKRDYLFINDFFDEWVLKNMAASFQLRTLVYGGRLLSTICRTFMDNRGDQRQRFHNNKKGIGSTQ